MGDTPDYSVMHSERLVAYIWRQTGGQLRRAGRRGTTGVRDIAYAEVVAYDAGQVDYLAQTLDRCRDFDEFLFRLRLDGYRVLEGKASPTARFRRF